MPASLPPSAPPASAQPTAQSPSTRVLPPWGALLDAQRVRSEQRAWRVAWCAVFLALLSVCGLIALAPYHRIAPFLLAVDRARGDIFPIGVVGERTLRDHQELLDKHWVQRYVVARESYVYRLLQEDYDTVCEMSADDEREKFIAIYDGPKARDKLYGTQTEIIVRIASVQLSSNAVGTQATVRFSTLTRRSDTGASEAPRYHIVTLAYRYQPGIFGSELALVRNPLGFKVETYRIAAELPPAEQATNSPTRQGG